MDDTGLRGSSARVLVRSNVIIFVSPGCLALARRTPASGNNGHRWCLTPLRGDESFEVPSDGLHVRHVSCDAGHHERALQRRDDEARHARDIDVIAELRAGFPQHRLELSRPPLEHRREPLPEPFVRVRHLGHEIAERAASTTLRFRLARHLGVDEPVEPIERVDHRVAQDRQALFRELLEAMLNDRVSQLLLRLEVVIEVGLSAETRLTDHVIDGSLLKSVSTDQAGGCFQDSSASVAHGRQTRTDRSYRQALFACLCKCRARNELQNCAPLMVWRKSRSYYALLDWVVSHQVLAI